LLPAEGLALASADELPPAGPGPEGTEGDGVEGVLGVEPLGEPVITMGGTEYVGSNPLGSTNVSGLFIT
jgi:hypothetical protein